MTGFSIVDAFVKSELTSSKGETRRAIQQGGIYINNQKCDSPDVTIKTSDLIGGTMVVLRKGKKKYALLKAAT